jgi:hypothetical protein
MIYLQPCLHYFVRYGLHWQAWWEAHCCLLSAFDYWERKPVQEYTYIILNTLHSYGKLLSNAEACRGQSINLLVIEDHKEPRDRLAKIKQEIPTAP